MKILFYYFMGGGGGGANIALFLQAFAKTFPGDHIDVLCHPSSALANIPESDNLSVCWIGESGSRKGKPPFLNTVSPLKHTTFRLNAETQRLRLGLWGLQAMAREVGADVIWTVNLGEYRRGLVPQVVSLRNAYQVYPWSEVARYHPGGRLSLAVLRWFTRRTLRVSSGISLQTERMASQLRLMLEVLPPLMVVGKPLESESEVPPRPLPEHLAALISRAGADGPFRYLYVAGPGPHKNHAVLLDAFRRLREQGEVVRLVVTTSLQDLEQIGGGVARDLVADGIVVPVGWVDKEHLKALYAASDACLMPSVLESLSSSHLEAMGWGKPQVTADLPYARDLCGEAALYADPDDGEAWAKQALRLMRDRELRERLVSAGLQKAAAFPADWADAARQVRAFLAEVAGV